MAADSKRKSVLQITSPAASNSFRQRVLLWFLQVFGAVAVVVFGTFTILAWRDNGQTIELSNVSNLISFIALCNDVLSNEATQQNSSSTALSTLCTRHHPIAIDALATFASRTFPLPRAIPDPTSSIPKSHRDDLSSGAIAAISFGSFLVAMIITALTWFSFTGWNVVDTVEEGGEGRLPRSFLCPPKNSF